MAKHKRLSFEPLDKREMLTTVGLTVVQPAIEGNQPGIIEIHRSESFGPLNVQIILDEASSTADATDFVSSPLHQLPSVIRMAHGQDSVQIEIEAISDGISERTETLRGRLVDLVGYDVDPTAAELDLAIHDNLEFADRTVLETPDGTRPRDWELEIANNSDAESEFFLQINGQLWVNLPHLIQHVRDMPEAHPGETDYQRAFRFMKDNTRHDYLISVEDSNWHRSSTTFLNSIGFGFCGDMSTALTFMWREMGYDSRVWRLSGHTVSEVFADGRWQMYDADLRVHFYNEDGHVAGVEELAANPILITRPINQVKVPDRISFNPYSGRMANIYSTTENNYVCETCYPDQTELERELQFTLPAGATIHVGDQYSDRELPLFDGEQTSWDFGQLKVTVPVGYTGEIDLALALFDVQGKRFDRVSLHGTQYVVNSDAAYQHINFDEAGRLGAVSFHDNKAPVELIYLINPKFAKLLQTNEIAVEQLSGAGLDVSLQAKADVPEQFAWDLTGTEGVVVKSSAGDHDGYVRRLDLQSEEGLNFVDRRYQFVDISTVPAQEIFNADSSFTVAASILLNEGDETRRPIVDSTRFSFLVNEENRLAVSYRTGDETRPWEVITSDVQLSADQWHEVSAKTIKQANGQMVELYVDGEMVGSKLAIPMSNTYTLNGPFIGLRYRAGNSEFFAGTMKHVSIDVHTSEQTPVAQEVIPPSPTPVAPPEIVKVDEPVETETPADIEETSDEQTSETSPITIAPAGGNSRRDRTSVADAIALQEDDDEESSDSQTESPADQPSLSAAIAEARNNRRRV